MKSLICMAAIGLALSCHGTDPGGSASIPAGQQIVAGWQYINFAWGYHHDIKFVDRDGKILVATYDASDSLFILTEMPTLTESEMARLVEKTSPLQFTMPGDSVLKIWQLTLSAADGPYSDTTQTGMDMGSQSWFSYLYDSQSHLYIRVECKVEGDWNYRNLNPAAEQVADMISAYVFLK